MSKVRLAAEADLARLCRTAVLAFADDPVMRWLYPDDEEFFAGGGAVMRFAMRRWMAQGSTFTTDDGVALAAFIPPGRPEVEVAPDPEAPPHPPDRLDRFRAIGTTLHEHTPTEPHWYLNLLGTHPDWQRQGLGALVMSPIFKRCDADGLPLWLETETVANVAYYQRFGFTVRSEWDVPLDGPHMWGMQRDPNN
jgi:GNAT superfamily N-acetyltransferase